MFPAFEDLKITTQTYVVHTNLTIPLEPFFDAVHCVTLKQPFSKKMDLGAENLKDGDIIYIQHKTDTKGIEKSIKKKQMLNVVTIIISYHSKLYNVKIAHSGKIQMTGCRGSDSVIYIVATIIRILRRNSILLIEGEDKMIVCYSICVMSNVNISIPFKIDRDKMHQYINFQTPHLSILEKSVGYVGVNVKIQSLIESKEESTIDKITFTRNGTHPLVEATTFSEYVEVCGKKKYKKDMYNSFLVFESGKTIMSGCSSFLNRKDAYNMFTAIVEGSREDLRLTDSP